MNSFTIAWGGWYRKLPPHGVRVLLGVEHRDRSSGTLFDGLTATLSATLVDRRDRPARRERDGAGRLEHRLRHDQRHVDGRAARERRAGARVLSHADRERRPTFAAGCSARPSRSRPSPASASPAVGSTPPRSWAAAEAHDRLHRCKRRRPPRGSRGPTIPTPTSTRPRSSTGKAPRSPGRTTQPRPSCTRVTSTDATATGLTAGSVLNFSAYSRNTLGSWTEAATATLTFEPLDAPVATVPVGNSPAVVAVDPLSHNVYVGNYYGDSVTVIDGVARSAVATIPMPTAGSIAVPITAAVDVLSGKAYVGNFWSNYVSAIDGSTLSIVATIAAPASHGSGDLGRSPSTRLAPPPRCTRRYSARTS